MNAAHTFWSEYSKCLPDVLRTSVVSQRCIHSCLLALILRIGAMNRHHTAQIWYLLLFFLVYPRSTCSIVHTVYITPSPSIHCPHEPCPTLEQIATNPNSYFGNDIDITLSLSFLPGNHSLDRELSLPYTNVSMAKDMQGSGTVFIECGSWTGRFNIGNATFAGIKDLH